MITEDLLHEASVDMLPVIRKIGASLEIIHDGIEWMSSASGTHKQKVAEAAENAEIASEEIEHAIDMLTEISRKLIGFSKAAKQESRPVISRDEQEIEQAKAKIAQRRTGGDE